MKISMASLSARLVAISLILTAAGCSTVSREGIQSVSIAPDDQSFVYSFQKGDESLIAIQRLDGGGAQIVVRSRDDNRYQRPVFSRDGGRLYFIARQTPARSDLSRIDVGSASPVRITRGQEGADNIQDFCLSADGNTLYYINSGYYGSYSPIAAARAHEMDFYSIRSDGTELRRLSHSKRYVLSGVSLAPTEQALFSRSVVLSLPGPGQLTQFDYYSQLLVFTSRYPLSEFANDGRVVLASSKVERLRPDHGASEHLVLREGWAVYGSGLYLVDIGKQSVNEILYLASALDSPALFHRARRILFVRNDSVWGGQSGNQLWSVDLDGSNLRRVELRLPQAAD